MATNWSTKELSAEDITQQLHYYRVLTEFLSSKDYMTPHPTEESIKIKIAGKYKGMPKGPGYVRDQNEKNRIILEHSRTYKLLKKHNAI